MPTAQQKLVKVGDDIVAFPSNMENDRIAKLVKSFHEKKKKSQPVATEESEHARQLKPAQPLSTAIPKLPAWANTPLVSDKDLEETPAGQALTAKSQAEFAKAHPKIEATLEKANTPVVLSGLQGVKEFTQGMLTPANMALMLGAPESKILSGIFATQAMRGSYSDAKAAQKAFEAGNNPEAIKYATQALLGLGVGALAGKHAYKGLPEGVRTQLASEEGSATLPTALKPTTAYQTVDQSKPFYLKSENLINEKMKGPMPAEDVHKMLLSNGVKPEEMQWTGLDEFLSEKGNSKVTPQEIQEHLAGNNLQIHEVVKTGDHNTELGPGEARYASYVLPGAEPQSYRELVLTMPPKMKEATPIEFKETERFKGEPVYRAEVKGGEAIISHNPGFPWRVDLPNGESDGGFPTAEAAMKAIKNNPRYQWTVPQNNVFKSNHWPEDVNPLGHIRFNDRIGLNGERILHIEELQSDMHQAGRRGRYTDPEKPFAVTGVAGQFATREEAQAAAKELFETSHLKGDPNNFVNDERVDRLPNGVVPDAPFKKTWPGLMLKRMIQYAAMHGYDGISWTPGEEQASRYDLSKQVDKIVVIPTEEGSRAVRIHTPTAGESIKLMVDKDGKVDPAFSSGAEFAGKNIADVVGKEVAEKIMSAPKETALTGVDLKVGGTGMKGFYDKIIPDAANKLGKQWGAKVGEMRLGAPQSTIDALKQEADAKYEVWSKLKNDAERHTGYVYGSPESSAVDEAYDAWGEALDKYKEAKTRPEYKVPYLPLHPQMRAGIKSVPYSLFGVGGVALGLNAVKQKADELQRKFRESGLAQ